MYVAEDVFQVQLPLPFALRTVNCYLLRDGDGWTLVDAGLHYEPGVVAWHAAFATLGIGPRDIRRIVLTHAHPDHYGMAGWLQQQSDAPVLLSAEERTFAEMHWHAHASADEATAALFGAHGMPEALVSTILRDIGALRAMAQPVPAHSAPIAPGDVLQVGRRRFVAVATPGHSEGHLALYCADERLLICGDAVLMRISPHVGLWPNSRPDPLGAFLGTLDELARLDVALALPGHGALISDLAGRAAELAAHHAQRLDVVLQAVGAGSSAFEVCGRVFALGELSTHQVRFAMAETLAHLVRLVETGRLARAAGAPVWFTRI